MDKPIIATILNIIPGLGYLYAGVRKPFAWILLASFITNTLAVMLARGEEAACTTHLTPSSIISMVSLLLIQLAIMVDVYLEVKESMKIKL